MVDMDFHSMKRKKLQGLCKKHGIPANLKNKEMADRLSLIYKEKEIEGTVGCGNAEMKKKTESNVELIDLVSPSPGLEKRSDFSAKSLKSSEAERLEFETNLSLEITREDMKSGLNKEHVGNENGGLDSAHDEVEDHLVEGEVEKFDDQSNLREDVYGTAKDGAKIKKQEDNNANNPEESNRNYLNLLVVSPEEFGYPLVEGEVHKSDEHVCVHDVVHNVESRRCDVDEKTEVAVEDAVHSSSEANSTEPNIIEMVVSGTVTRNAESCEARLVSSAKMSLCPASERMISLSPKLLNDSVSKMLESVTNISPETLKADNEVCNVKENIPIDDNKEQVGDSPEVVPAAPNEMAMSDEDLEQVPSDEFGDRLIDGEVEKMGHKSNIEDDVCENGKGGDEAVEGIDLNSPQESNMKDVNVLPVSQEESGYPLMEEIWKSGDNIYDGDVYKLDNSGCKVDAKDTDEKTNLTAEPFADDVPSSSLDKYSEGTPDQFERKYTIKEVKSTGFNVLQDICEEKMEKVEYSQKAMNMTDNVNILDGSMEQCDINIEQEELTRLLDNSDVHDDAGRNAEVDTNSLQDSNRTDMNLSQVSHKEFGYHLNLSPETQKVDIEVCDVKENFQVDINKELVGGNQEVVHAAFDVMAISDEDLEQDPFEEFGDHSMEGEVEKLIDKNDVLEDVCENRKGRDEALENSDHNSPQGSNMKNGNVLHVSQEESGFPLVEEIQKSDDNIYTGGAYNLGNGGSEVDAKDTDVITDLTAEPFADNVPNVPSIYKYSEGTPDHFLKTSLNDVNSSGLNMHQDTCNEEMKSPQATVPIAGPGECIGFFNNITVEQFMDEIRSSTFEDSDGTPVQFLLNGALSQVKSNLNISEMDVPGCKSHIFPPYSLEKKLYKVLMNDYNLSNLDVLGIVIGNKDTPEAKYISSRKRSLSPTSERTVGFSPKQSNNSETKVLQSETIFFPETSRVVDSGICDVEENKQIDVNKVMHAASSVTVSNNEDLVKVTSVEVGDNLLEEEVEKSGLIADSEECIVFLFNNLESSLPAATKGFQDELHFGPSTLGDVVETCDVQNDQMEKEHSQDVLHMENELDLLQTSTEESNSVEEVTRLFDNSNFHEDAGVTGAEHDKNQRYIERDIDSIEKYLLGEFDASGQNSDENAPTMPQHGEMISASGTICGDEGIIQEKLETPLKCAPIASLEDSISFYPNLLESSMKKELKIVKSLPVKRARDVLGTSDMKENIKSVKKEQAGTVISKSAFPKRKPLQHVQQN